MGDRIAGAPAVVRVHTIRDALERFAADPDVTLAVGRKRPRSPETAELLLVTLPGESRESEEFAAVWYAIGSIVDPERRRIVLEGMLRADRERAQAEAGEAMLRGVAEEYAILLGSACSRLTLAGLEDSVPIPDAAERLRRVNAALRPDLAEVFLEASEAKDDVIRQLREEVLALRAELDAIRTPAPA